jgi:hypothetical protein
VFFYFGRIFDVTAIFAEYARMRDREYFLDLMAARRNMNDVRVTV